MKKSEMQDILRQIAGLASRVANSEGGDHISCDDHAGANIEETPVCTPKTLPARLLEEAAATAVKINPMNSPQIGPVVSLDGSFELTPSRISVVVSKFWGPASRKISVSFMEPASAQLRSRIISHLNAWTRTGSIQFVETNGTGVVRISRGPGGYWSYLGTDVNLIPQNRQTMNLQGFTMHTSESEFIRVVRHEAGHTLGFPHEHMRPDLIARIDREKAYKYYLRNQGWDRQTVDQQVLTPLDERSIFGTPPDQTSIMCYQMPGSITTDGRPIVGGLDINATDYAFVGKIYPKPTNSNEMVGHDCACEHNDWDIGWK